MNPLDYDVGQVTESNLNEPDAIIYLLMRDKILSGVISDMVDIIISALLDTSRNSRRERKLNPYWSVI